MSIASGNHANHVLNAESSSLKSAVLPVMKQTTKPKKYPWSQLWHIYGYIFLGGCDTIVYKYQNTTQIDGQYFKHPFIQTFMMFFGMSLPMIWVIYKKQRKTYDLEKDPSKKVLTTIKDYSLVLIPSMCDLIVSTLQFFSLLFVDSSIFQMMRGGSIIFTAIFSKWFFSKNFMPYKYLGLFLVIIGLVLVGLSNFLFVSSDSKQDANTQLFFLGVLCICMALDGYYYTFEEYIYSKYNIHPCELIGIESQLQAFYDKIDEIDNLYYKSVFGSIVYVFILIWLCHQQCPFRDGVGCVKVGDTFYMESVSLYWKNISSHGWLFTFVIFGIFTKCIYNLNGVSVTRYFSSLTRSVAGALRTLVTWIIGLVVTALGLRQWENLDYRTNLIKTLAYIILFIGNLVYNGKIKIPYFDRENERQVKDDHHKVIEVMIQSEELFKNKIEMSKNVSSKTSTEVPTSYNIQISEQSVAKE